MKNEMEKFGPQPSRQPVKWMVSASAVGAAMAMATNAQAEIIYSGAVDLAISNSHSGPSTAYRPISIDRGGEYLGLAHGATHSYRAAIFPQTSASVVTAFALKFAAPNGFAKLYNSGNAILGNNTATSAVFRHGGLGNWGPGTVTGFAGFKAANGDLGWMRVKVENGAMGPNYVEIIDYAYNSGGGPINAGQETSVSSAPEPGTMALALLGGGAVGMLAFRRRRAELKA